MGKKLIIEGADFSANAVAVELTPVDITDLLSFVTNWNGINDSSQSNRSGVSPRFDISSYITQGYTKIRITVTTSDDDPAGVFPFMCSLSTGDAYGNYETFAESDGYLGPGIYEKNISDFSASMKYLGVNIDTSKVGNYSNLSDYMKVELLS